MRGAGTVARAAGVAVLIKRDIPLAEREHGFKSEYHAEFKFYALARVADVFNKRLFVDGFTDAVPAEVFHHRIAVLLCDGSNRGSDIARVPARPCGRDSRIKRFAGRFYKLRRFSTYFPYRNRYRMVKKITFIGQTEVKRHNISLLEYAFLGRNTMHYFIVY